MITIKELKKILTDNKLIGRFDYPALINRENIKRNFKGKVMKHEKYMTIDGLIIPYENLVRIKNRSMNMNTDPLLEIETYFGIGEIKLLK